MGGSGETHIVLGLLIFISLLVSCGLLLIGLSLLLGEGLPSVTENLADLTEADAGVLLTNVLTLFVGEEHVSGKTTLGSIGVCKGLAR
jgi:hypothetical protein